MTTLQGELFDIIRKDRARRTRRDAAKKALTNLIGATLGNVLNALLQGWFLMLGVEIAHEHWLPTLPTIGYWWAVLLVYLLRGTFSASRTTGKDAA